jgi:hypothetical protein
MNGEEIYNADRPTKLPPPGFNVRSVPRPALSNSSYLPEEETGLIFALSPSVIGNYCAGEFVVGAQQ